MCNGKHSGLLHRLSFPQSSARSSNMPQSWLNMNYMPIWRIKRLQITNSNRITKCLPKPTKSGSPHCFIGSSSQTRQDPTNIHTNTWPWPWLLPAPPAITTSSSLALSREGWKAHGIQNQQEAVGANREYPTELVLVITESNCSNNWFMIKNTSTWCRLLISCCVFVIYSSPIVIDHSGPPIDFYLWLLIVLEKGF